LNSFILIKKMEPGDALTLGILGTLVHFRHLFY
jgi:hypothetical protein